MKTFEAIEIRVRPKGGLGFAAMIVPVRLQVEETVKTLIPVRARLTVRGEILHLVDL